MVVRGMAADGGELQTSPKVEEKLGVRIERNPSESRLSELGIRSWPKYDTPSLFLLCSRIQSLLVQVAIEEGGRGIPYNPPC